MQKANSHSDSAVPILDLLTRRETTQAHKLIKKWEGFIREILDPSFGYRTPSELLWAIQDQLAKYAPWAKISSIQRRDPHKRGFRNNFYDHSTRTDITIDEKYIGSYPMLGEDEIYIPLLNSTKYIVIRGIGEKKKELFHTIKHGMGSEFEKSTRLIAQLNEDKLTWAYNRQFLESFWKDHTSESMEKGGKKFVVFGIDLDGFKEINDQLGHDVWDKALITATEVLQKVFWRGIDYVCRVSGDEFVVIIDATDWKGNVLEANISLFTRKIHSELMALWDDWIPKEKTIENPPKIWMTVWVGFMDSKTSLEKAIIDADMDMLRKKPELWGVLRIARKLRNIKNLWLIPVVLHDLKAIPWIQEFPEDDKSRVSTIIDELSQIFARNTQK